MYHQTFEVERGAVAAIVRELAAAIEDEALRRGFLAGPDVSALAPG